MPTVSESALSVAANAKSTNRLSGTDIDFLPFDAALELFAKASATGLNATLSIGGEVVVNDQPIPFTGTAGTLAIPDNLMDSVAAAAGAKVTLSFRNTTGGAITVDYVVKASPL